MLTYDSGKKLGKDFFSDYKASIEWADVILAGPGLGTGNISVQLLKVLSETVNEKKKLVLDADALNNISSADNDIKFSSFTSKVGLGKLIITPHMMEMLRIVRSRYDKKTYDFMLSGLGYKSDMDFLGIDADTSAIDTITKAFHKNRCTLLIWSDNLSSVSPEKKNDEVINKVYNIWRCYQQGWKITGYFSEINLDSDSPEKATFTNICRNNSLELSTENEYLPENWIRFLKD